MVIAHTMTVQTNRNANPTSRAACTASAEHIAAIIPAGPPSPGATAAMPMFSPTATAAVSRLTITSVSRVRYRPATISLRLSGSVMRYDFHPFSSSYCPSCMPTMG